MHHLQWMFFQIFSITFLPLVNHCPSKTRLWKQCSSTIFLVVWKIVRTPSLQTVLPVALDSSYPAVTLSFCKLPATLLGEESAKVPGLQVRMQHKLMLWKMITVWLIAHYPSGTGPI